VEVLVEMRGRLERVEMLVWVREDLLSEVSVVQGLQVVQLVLHMPADSQVTTQELFKMVVMPQVRFQRLEVHQATDLQEVQVALRLLHP
jgi:hypothetical protein